MNWTGLVFVLLSSVPASARVFNLAKESFGSYLVFSGAQSNLKDTPFKGESSVTSYSDTYGTITGAEFGFVYVTPRYGFRFGFETIKPAALESNALTLGAKKYTVTSDLSVIIPKIGMDIIFVTGSWYRVTAFGVFGMGSLTGSSTYSSVTISPNVAHTSEMKSSANMSGGGLSAEVAMLDTTTFLLEVGYRQLKFVDVIYSKDVTTFDGAHVAGDTVNNVDGTRRMIDFTGAFVNVGFRIYLF